MVGNSWTIKANFFFPCHFPVTFSFAQTLKLMHSALQPKDYTALKDLNHTAQQMSPICPAAPRPKMHG